MSRKIGALMLFVVMLTSCGGDNYTPKPRGYFRIELPEREYERLQVDCPYSFEYNENAQWQPQKVKCWGDVYYPNLKARLQLTYKKVNDNIDTLLNEGRDLAFQHVVKADGIKENLIYDTEKRMFGILYQIKGEAATNTQFFVTDSTDHFLRGVLYFYAEPNEDSLRPVNDYMYEEVVHLIETLQWQNSLP